MENFRRTYIKIDNKVIEKNARTLVDYYNNYDYAIAVVKGNAYGHGYGIIPALIRGGIDAFAVSNLNEALEVRKIEDELPVIMLEPVHARYYDVCAENNISVCINDSITYREAVDSGFSLKIHIKVDCGMNRLGFKDREELERIVKDAMGNERLTVEGLFTHFHTSGILDREYENNLKRFKELTVNLPLDKIPMVHIDKTQTVLVHEKQPFATGVRFGIALYGFKTVASYSADLKGRLRKLKYELKRRNAFVKPSLPCPTFTIDKAFTLYSEVIQVKRVKPGEYVGYGLGHKAATEEYVATIDVGYADGINRKRVGSHVAINGKKYPIIGDIGMGMCEILADDSVKRHDVVTVLGGDIPIPSICMHLNTTMYELMTGLDSSIPRIYED